MCIALTILIVVVSYLIGAIPFGLLIVKRIRGIDIRKHGSGNIGSTNVARVIGRKWAALVFLLDFAKGFLPVAAVILLLPEEGGVRICCGLAAIAGHMFPLYLKFRGGKGVATGTGVLTAIAPLPLAVAFAVWCLFTFLSGYISAGSISAAIALPVSFILLNQQEAFNDELIITIFCLVVGVLVVVSHRSNIKRLLTGTENSFRRKSEDANKRNR